MEWIGYVGLGALGLCWIPQSVETIRLGRCFVNLYFLILSAIGSGSLIVYAVYREEAVFVLVNALTTSGALVNLFYKLFPRTQ